MQHGFQRASLAPDGFAIDAVQVVADIRAAPSRAFAGSASTAAIGRTRHAQDLADHDDVVRWPAAVYRRRNRGLEPVDEIKAAIAAKRYGDDEEPRAAE